MNFDQVSNITLYFQFEADRRAIIITINSFGTELSKDDRAKLYPRCGKLNPDGLAALARADDYEQVKAVAEYYAEYSALFEGAGNNVGDKTLEDKFFEHEVCILFYICCGAYKSVIVGLYPFLKSVLFQSIDLVSQNRYLGRQQATFEQAAFSLKEFLLLFSAEMLPA